MNDPTDVSIAELAKVGLCVKCGHAQRVVSAKGSTFWLCTRSRLTPGFPKYPRLPVVSCEGHEPGAPA